MARSAQDEATYSLFVIRYSLFVNRYSLWVAVPGNWRGERNDEICYAYMKAFA